MNPPTVLHQDYQYPSSVLSRVDHGANQVFDTVDAQTVSPRALATLAATLFVPLPPVVAHWRKIWKQSGLAGVATNLTLHKADLSKGVIRTILTATAITIPIHHGTAMDVGLVSRSCVPPNGSRANNFCSSGRNYHLRLLPLPHLLVSQKHSFVTEALVTEIFCRCITARRRRRQGLSPYRGTGWAAGVPPPGHGPAQYTGAPAAQPYYGNNATAPPYSPLQTKATITISSLVMAATRAISVANRAALNYSSHREHMHEVPKMSIQPQQALHQAIRRPMASFDSHYRLSLTKERAFEKGRTLSSVP